MSTTGITQVNDENFEREVIKSSLPVVVDFYADWCGPCRQVEPILASLSASLQGKVKFTRLNVDESEKTAETFGVHAIPTFVFVEGGTEKGRQVGLLAEAEFQRIVKKTFTFD